MDRLKALLAGLAVAHQFELEEESRCVDAIKRASDRRNWHNSRATRYSDAIRALRALIAECYAEEGQS